MEASSIIELIVLGGSSPVVVAKLNHTGRHVDRLPPRFRVCAHDSSNHLRLQSGSSSILQVGIRQMHDLDTQISLASCPTRLLHAVMTLKSLIWFGKLRWGTEVIALAEAESFQPSNSLSQ